MDQISTLDILEDSEFNSSKYGGLIISSTLDDIIAKGGFIEESTIEESTIDESTIDESVSNGSDGSDPSMFESIDSESPNDDSTSPESSESSDGDASESTVITDSDASPSDASNEVNESVDTPNDEPATMFELIEPIKEIVTIVEGGETPITGDELIEELFPGFTDIGKDDSKPYIKQTNDIKPINDTKPINEVKSTTDTPDNVDSEIKFESNEPSASVEVSKPEPTAGLWTISQVISKIVI